MHDDVNLEVYLQDDDAHEVSGGLLHNRTKNRRDLEHAFITVGVPSNDDKG